MLLASLLLVELADEWFGEVPAAALPEIQADLGLSYADAGLLLALLPAGSLVGNTFTVAADFVSRRVLASGGALVVAGCLATFAVADSFVALAAAAFVWGAASDAFVHGATVALADLAGDDELDGTLARTNLLAGIGSLLGPLSVALAAAAGWGWRPLFGFGAVAMALYALWLATSSLPRPTPNGHTPWGGVRATLRDRRVVRLAVVLGLWDTVDLPFVGFATAFLVADRGYSAGGAAAAVGVWTLGALAGYAFAAARPATDRERGLRRAAGLRLVAMIAVVVPAPLPVIVVGAALLGLSGAWFWVPYQAEVLRLRPGQPGTTWAVIAWLSLPGLALPPLIGAIADRSGLAVGMVAYLTVPVLVLAVLALPVRLRRLSHR